MARSGMAGGESISKAAAVNNNNGSINNRQVPYNVW